MNYSQLGTYVYTAANIPQTLLVQYGRLRYRCFDPNDPNVNMSHWDKTELDHFDRDPNTLYVMVVARQAGGSEQLISALRLRPTLVDYELEMESYRYLTEGVPLPKDAQIYEGSRWVGQSSRSTEGMLSTAMLLTRVFHLSKELAFQEIIGTISTLSENWMSRRQMDAQRESTLYHSSRDKLDIMVSRIPVNEDFLAMANILLQGVLRQNHLDTVAISLPELPQAA